MCSLILISKEVWTPMHGRCETVDSTCWVVLVASTLHDIDLPTGWPFAVLFIARQHPDGGPKPVALRQLSPNLNLAILEGEGIDSGQLPTHNRIDDVVSIRTSLTSIVKVGSAVVSWRPSPKIHCEATSNILRSNQFLSQNGFDIELGVLHEGSRPVVVIHLEFPVATPCQGDIVLPLFVVQSLEIVFKDNLGCDPTFKKKYHQKQACQDLLHCNRVKIRYFIQQERILK